MHRRADGRIDPDIYKEFKYSADGRARILIALKQPDIPKNTPWEERKELVRRVNEAVLARMGPGEFEVTHNYTSFVGLAGRITAKGLKRLKDDPNLIVVGFSGPFSLPEEWVVEQDCE
jgi:hypothetical protein